jgi:hypothetical protein
MLYVRTRILCSISPIADSHAGPRNHPPHAPTLHASKTERAPSLRFPARPGNVFDSAYLAGGYGYTGLNTRYASS